MMQPGGRNVTPDPAVLAPEAASGGRSASVAGAVVMGLLVALATVLPAAAQDRVYRCGNEYTNQLKGRTDCKLVEGGNVTIVQSTAPRRAAATAPAAQTPAKQAPTAADVLQRRREADAKAILEQELRRAQQRQTELEAEYNDGQPDKIGGEARNYQKYLDRVADLEAALERNQSDIEGIERELERYK